jgi:hypothetical protein
MLMIRERRPAYRTIEGWARSVLLEVGAIRECEQHGWMQDRADPHARDRAFAFARQDPPAGVSPEAAAVTGVAASISSQSSLATKNTKCVERFSELTVERILDGGKLRHRGIDNRDIRRQIPDCFDAACGVATRRNDLEIGYGTEHVAEPVQDHRMAVCNDYSDTSHTNHERQKE